MCPYWILPDSVEDVHRKRASLHRQNPTRVLAGVSGFIQVEEIMKFLLIMIILVSLVKNNVLIVNFCSIKRALCSN